MYVKLLGQLWWVPWENRRKISKLKEENNLKVKTYGLRIRELKICLRGFYLGVSWPRDLIFLTAFKTSSCNDVGLSDRMSVVVEISRSLFETAERDEMELMIEVAVTGNFYLPGRTSINEQLLSIQSIDVRPNSSMLAVDTVALYELRSGSKIWPNWNNSLGQ